MTRVLLVTMASGTVHRMAPEEYKATVSPGSPNFRRWPANLVWLNENQVESAVVVDEPTNESSDDAPCSML